MIKKTLIAILTGLLIIGMVGCDKKEKQTNDVAPMTAETKEVLPGEWSKNFTREEVNVLNDDILSRMEEVATYYGLDYEISEEVKEDNNGVTVNDKHLNVNIEDPEPNRLESINYSFKQFGTDLASGQLTMKLTSVLDRNAIKEEGSFDFADTSFAIFSQAFTGVEDRDYTQLSEDIYNKITGNEEVATIENNLDGVKETISITKDFLLYTLETKEYKFK